MPLSPYNHGAADALAKLAAVKISARGPVDPAHARVDQLLKDLHTRAGELEAQGDMLSRKRMLGQQMAVADTAETLESALKRMQAQSMQDYSQLFADKGQAPRRNLLNRLTFGRFGRDPSRPDRVHRDKDIQEAVNRARAIVPDELRDSDIRKIYRQKGLDAAYRASQKAGGPTKTSPAASGGMGALAKMGLGAAALAGGGYLLNKMLQPDEPQAHVTPTDVQYATFR